MMNRTILLAAVLLPLAACGRSPNVEYQPDGYRNSPEMAPAARVDAVEAKPVVQRPPTGRQRFERDFGNDGRFVYSHGFRLDSWTGCVTVDRTGVPIVNARQRPECSYRQRIAQFERDFGSEGRFLYSRGFRLDSWTGCVTVDRTGLPIMNARQQPECSYAGDGIRKD